MSTGPGFSKASLVYHFTDTVRLPWIIESGELQPDKNRIGGYPADLLWATTNDIGDRTSSTMLDRFARRAYRDGFLYQVRITLGADDFVPWREMIEAAPMWTTDHVARLEQAAIEAGERNIEAWCCRSTALPFARAVYAHIKSFSGRWKQIKATPEYCLGTSNADGQRGFVVGYYAYLATRTQNAAGMACYRDLSGVVVIRQPAPAIEMLHSSNIARSCLDRRSAAACKPSKGRR